MKKTLILFLFLLITLRALPQDKKKITEEDYANRKVEMADQFREDGKIYVVVAVVLTILSGLIIYLVIVDRKVTRLENEMRKRNE